MSVLIECDGCGCLIVDDDDRGDNIDLCRRCRRDDEQAAADERDFQSDWHRGE